MDNRYYFEKVVENYAIIENQEAIHLLKVRRAKINDEIVGFNGDGYDYLLKLKNITKNSAECEIINKSLNVTNFRPNLTIYLASIKSDALSEALDGLTQLNVKDIVIFESNFTNVKYDEKKIEKLRIHFIQSCKQCERADIPNIRFISFNELLAELKNKDLSIFAYENAKENFNSIDFNAYTNKSVSIVVGGEGGFSEEEANALDKVSKRVSMGKTILRAKVAVIVLAGAVLSRLDTWKR